MKNQPIVIAGIEVKPGEQKTIEIPLAAMVTHHNVEMTAHVIHGRKKGPCLFVCAAIHGDEINGVEIIRRLLKNRKINRLSGTLIAIPIVNVHGFITHTRYLPDGRDLNRSFPGSSKGSLASRMANTFLNEVVTKCTHGIDIHTGARHRDNLPQIRADMSCEKARALSEAFGVPAIIDAKIRDGSLREAASDLGIPMLLYEAGEALRFDELAIRAGVKGVQNVMRSLEMMPKTSRKESQKKPIITSNTSWVRAPSSGIHRALVPLGAKAEKGSILGVIADPLGLSEYHVVAPEEGVVLGRSNLPLVHEGDALFHLAFYKQKVSAVVDQGEIFQENLENDIAVEAGSESMDGPIL